MNAVMLLVCALALSAVKLQAQNTGGDPSTSPGPGGVPSPGVNQGANPAGGDSRQPTFPSRLSEPRDWIDRSEPAETLPGRPKTRGEALMRGTTEPARTESLDRGAFEGGALP